MFRLAAEAVYLFIIFICSLILIPLAYLIGCFDKQRRDTFSFHIVRYFLRVILRISGARVTYKGLENLPGKNETVCYVGNHRGIFDIVVLYSLLPSAAGFIAKIELKKVPLVNWWMKLINCPFIDRDNKRQNLKVILDGIENIKNGISMIIYPEGTRSLYDGQLLPFKEGSFKLATKPGVKIIPVAINNTGAVFEDNLPKISAVNICIEFAPPIDTASLSADKQKNLNVTVRNIIEEMAIRNGIEIGTLPEGFVPDPNLIAAKKIF